MPFRVPIDADFDVAFANRIARLEAYNKHHYRPNSYLHKWWARRCGSTFRLILKQLVLNQEQRDYYAAGGLDGKVILDPMMGGGTTLHEAIRMGANVIGADLDPIPVLQARASLSTIPLPVLERAFERFYESLQREIGPYFSTICPVTKEAVPAWYVLYGVQRVYDGEAVLVVDSTLLRQESDGTTIRICPHCHDIVYGSTTDHCSPQSSKLMIMEKGNGRFQDDLSVPYYQRYVPLVLVGRSSMAKQPFFKTPDAHDLAHIEQANRQRARLTFRRADFEIEAGRKSRQLLQRGIENYLDLFSSRQLIYLEQAISLLPQFEPLVRLNLALLVSTSLEFNSMLCGYKGKSKRRAGAIRHAFSHHAYSFPYTALENNPVYPRKASGTLQKLFQARIRNGRLWAQRPRERQFTKDNHLFREIPGEQDAGKEVTRLDEISPHHTRRFLLRQGSSVRLDLPADCVDYIVTDPPYFDSVQYSDLSAFFRVWLQKLLPDAANWRYDMRDSAVDPHKLDRESRYEELLGRIFQTCHRVLRKANGRFIFTFHHWNPKAWAALTLALKRAHFVLINRYVVYSEHPISVHIANMKSLTHDAILVLAPVEAGVGSVWERPSAINLNDSQQFCQDCGTLLGWLLNADMSAAAISQTWYQMLER